MLSAAAPNDKFRRSTSPSYANFSMSGPSSGYKKAVTVGICAMEKKSLSKPMKEILTRLEEFEYINTNIFPEAITYREKERMQENSIFIFTSIFDIPST